VALKTCVDCGIPKDLEDDFYVQKDRLDGRRQRCKDCDNANRWAYDDQSPEPEEEEIPAAYARPGPAPGKRTTLPNNVLKGIAVPEDLESPAPGMWRFTTPKGWRVLVVHYTADPNKCPGRPVGDAWIAKAKKAQGSDRDWQREMEINYTISSDQPFFPNFNRSVHVRPLLFDPKIPLLRGWDFGQAHPACVFAQLGGMNQVRVHRSVLETNKKIWDFGEQVVGLTNIHFPGAKKIVDYGDPAGAQESDKGASTHILLERFGIHMNMKFSYREEGLKIMDQKLRVMENGEPGMLIDPEGNPLLIEGFEGGYVLDVGATGKDKEGRLKNHPKKDGIYEHLFDALRYLMLNIFSMVEEERDDNDAWDKASLWRTNRQHLEKRMKDAYDEALL